MKTGIFSLEKASKGEDSPSTQAAGDESSSSANLDGCLYMYDMSGDKGHACVIANSDSSKPFESELKSAMSWKNVSMSSKTPIAT